MKPNSDLKHLEKLVGKWEVEGLVDGKPAGRGKTKFSWIEDGLFLKQQSRDLPPQPDVPKELKEFLKGSPNPVTTIIGLDDSSGQFTQLYADARGVFRVYQMSLNDSVWKLWRDAPGFSQRFKGTFSEDKNTITGRWESSDDGKNWETDFDLTYSKIK